MQFPRRTGPTLPDADSGREAPAAEYCRQARRLRHELRDNPIRLHQQLAKLAAKPLPRGEGDEPAQPPYMRIARPITGNGLPLQCPPLAAEAFAAEVDECCCCDGVLRYSERVALLRQAAKLNISRFEANLIIATVLHRNACEETSDTKRRPYLSLIIMLFFAAEALIALAAWKIFG